MKNEKSKKSNSLNHKSMRHTWDRDIIFLPGNELDVKPGIVHAADIGVFLCDRQIEDRYKIEIIKLALIRLANETCFTLRFYIPHGGPSYRIPMDSSAYWIMKFVTRDKNNDPEWAEVLSLLEFEMY